MKLPYEPKPGQPMDYTWGVQVVRCLRALQPQAGNGMMIKEGTNSTIYSLTPDAGLPVLKLIAAALATAEAYTDDETDRALAAEAVLEAEIVAEVARATAAEAALEAEITTEVARAVAAEDALQDQIDAQEAEIVTLQGQVTALEAIAADYTAFIAASGYIDGANLGGGLNLLTSNAGYGSIGGDPLADLGTAIYDLYNNAGYGGLASMGTDINGLVAVLGGLAPLTDLGHAIDAVFGVLGGVSGPILTSGGSPAEVTLIEDDGTAYDCYVLPGGTGAGSNLGQSITVYDGSCESSTLTVVAV